MNHMESVFFPQGSRQTPLKRALFALFESETRPLSIPEIQNLLRPLEVNKTSLYRQLEAWVRSGALQEVTLSAGVQHYERAMEHHHHFVCQSCEAVTDVHHHDLEDVVGRLEAELAERGLFVSKHEFNLFGTCHTCNPLSA